MLANTVSTRVKEDAWAQCFFLVREAKGSRASVPFLLFEFEWNCVHKRKQVGTGSRLDIENRVERTTQLALVIFALSDNVEHWCLALLLFEDAHPRPLTRSQQKNRTPAASGLL
jgi:hypothetical protein